MRMPIRRPRRPVRIPAALLLATTAIVAALETKIPPFKGD
jgi:hypothetical protein